MSAHRLAPLLLFLLAFTLAGCGRGNTSTPQSPPLTPAPTSMLTPTATATATAMPTATPVPTATTAPTATFTPTPIPAPPELLDAAARLLHNGNYSAAAALFQDFIDLYPGHVNRGEAELGRAKALWLDGKTLAAADILAALSQTDYVAEHAEVLYWLGRALADAGASEAAADAFQTYAERRPVLADWAYQAAGNAYFSDLDPANAIAHYRQALAAAPDTASKLRAREGIAAASLNAGDLDEALAQYQIILTAARNPGYRTEMLYQQAQVQRAAAQLPAAWASLQQALTTEPKSTYAYLALLDLDSAGETVDGLNRGRVLLGAKDYQAAISALYIYLETTPVHDGEAHELAARAYEATGNYAGAAVEWRKLIDTHPGDPLVGAAWLGLGRGQWREGDTAAAQRTYIEAANADPDPESAGEALWWAGTLADRSEDTLLEAAAIFQRLADDYPDTKYGEHGAFRAGLSYFQAGDAARAQTVWTKFAASGDGLWQAAADYWLGKAMRVEGEEAGAIEHWRGVAERWGEGNIYGLMAASGAQITASFVGEPTQSPSPNGAADTALLSWLRTWVVDVPDDLAAARPEFLRPTELHRIGAAAAARTDFEALRLRWRQDPAALLQLALRTRDLGYYDTSIRAAAGVQALSKMALAETPLALQTLIYPIYYDDIILPAAARNGLEPALFLALIRQESLFGASAASSAAASGLTQVIPSTGAAIAERMNWPDYRQELLYRPYVSVEFGAFYLAEGIAGAGGNVLQALAGYNGGPGNAAFWRRQAGEDDDLYMELVSFDETQLYLRVISVQAQHYRRIYPHLASE